MNARNNSPELPLEEIRRCTEVLRTGGILLYPTDTIWGLGCDATNAQAVEKIFKIKQRAESKSLIVLLDQPSQLNRYVQEVPAVAWDLIELSEDPLTIIYDDVKGMAPNVVAADGSCGIRICEDEFCRRMIRQLGRPLVSTSANISGQAAPMGFRDISKEIIQGVDHVAAWRQQEHHPSNPSKIIRLRNNGEVTIIR
ncbi:MAG TPA: L-threonylcarbamoyladenylate synthase [Bacteroidia bacterium]|jgi:L-threonylcarbamoyladenylate synthase|nr:L-threonylcarbamoyladenylate synthase [Bacteroidia bacterium]